TTRKTAEHAEGAGRHPPRSGMSAQVDGTDTQPPEDDRGGHHADKNHQSHRQNGAGKQEAFLLRDAHEDGDTLVQEVDRKSTRLNSSHVKISYAVFCLKKKKQQNNIAHNVR